MGHGLLRPHPQHDARALTGESVDGWECSTSGVDAIKA